MRILLVGMLLITLILSGCSAITGEPNSAVVLPPADELRYEISRTVVTDTEETVTIPTDFTLLDAGPKIDNFYAGCEADYFTQFWYVPLQTDYFLGDPMTGNKTTDTAILTKGLYKNDSLGVTYLDNVYSVDFTDKNKNKISIKATPIAQSYNPQTKELIISGFPQESQNYFSVTYFHNQDGKFNIYYAQPASMTPGFDYIPEAQSWVELPGTQTVKPFTVRCAPVNLIIPADAVVPNKFEFCIGVTETISGTGSGVAIPRALQQRWLVSCREAY